MADSEPSRKAKYDVQSANEVKHWIELVIGEQLPSNDLIESLKDGVALCKLVNIISPGIAKYKSSSMPFVQMENIAAFLKAAEVIGVPHYELFETVDLFDERDPVQILITVRSLSRHAHLKNPSVEVLGPKLQSPNPVKNRDFKPTNIPAWNTRQYGSLEGANQGTEGVIFGGTRNIIAPKSKPAPPAPNIIIGSSGNSNFTPTKIPPKPGPKPIGLSLKGARSGKQAGPSVSSRSIFGEAVDEDDQGSFSGKKQKNQFLDDRKRMNAQIAAQGINNQKLVELSSLDPSAYSYDEVYDTMKAIERKTKEDTNKDNEGDGKVSYLNLPLVMSG